MLGTLYKWHNKQFKSLITQIQEIFSPLSLCKWDLMIQDSYISLSSEDLKFWEGYWKMLIEVFINIYTTLMQMIRVLNDISFPYIYILPIL